VKPNRSVAAGDDRAYDRQSNLSMMSNCILCGSAISQGILCANCDRPRRAKAPASEEAVHGATAVLAPNVRTSSLPLDPVLPSIAIISNVLVAAGAAAVILDADRSVKLVTEEMRHLLGEITHVRQIEEAVGIAISDLARLSSNTISLRSRKMLLTVVPFSGGAALVLRQTAEIDEPPQISDIPRVVDVIRSVVNRSIAFAEVKGIHLEVSTPETEERFRHHDKLADALGILLDNSLHYVSAGGQVVVGVRLMEHKGKPILLFFVMDNGPLVPEHMKHIIFESGFIWNTNAAERTGKGLFKIREFATGHGGSVWVDSKTGKACTFFLRVNPDPPH
jgi:signal transduction histidine kinase